MGLFTDLATDLKKPDKPQDPVDWVREVTGYELWSKQREILHSVQNNKQTAVQSCHGSGKAELLTQLIATPSGWSTIGQLKAGDYVFNELGKPIRVKNTSQPWLGETYRVEFSDNTTVDVHENHEWSVLDLNNRPRKVDDWRNYWNRTVVKETKYLAANLKTSLNQNRWRIPTTEALSLPSAELPIDPYTVGYWLGNGSNHNPGEISLHVQDLEEIRSLIPYDSWLPNSQPDGLGRKIRVDGLQTAIKNLGLAGNKHIPAQYLRASKEQRIELLQGLMDSDGYRTDSGSDEICLTDKQLSLDVLELINTLGIVGNINESDAKLNGRIVSRRWKISARFPFKPYKLSRYDWNPGNAQQSRMTIRTIKNIYKIEPQLTKCIEVESERNLYLTGKSLIPTHNSMLASLLAAWWIDTHPYDDTIVITTAPSKNQVHGILWENIRKIAKDAKLPGDVQLSDNWYINRRLVGQGRKPQDYNNSVFQGIHREFVLFILDEAGGVSPGLWTAAITNTTSEHCRILAIGNPDDPGSEFARVCQRDPKWNTIKISLWETPNFTGEEVSEKAAKNLVDDTYLETARTAWGESSPLWASKVDGEFPTVDDFAVCPVDWVLRAFERHEIYMDSPPPVRDEFSGPERKILGVDVARYGKDKSVIATRVGDVFTDIEGFTMRDNVELANLVMKRMNKARDKAIVDINGVGSGVYDILKSRGYKVEGFMAGAKTKEKDLSRKMEFTRVRSAAWWKLREALDPTNGPTIAFPDVETQEQELLSELTTPRWEQVLNGQIQVESKEDIKKRLDRSTDYADAVIMAWWAKPHVINSVEDAAVNWIDDFSRADEIEDGALSWNLDDDWRDGIAYTT